MLPSIVVVARALFSTVGDERRPFAPAFSRQSMQMPRRKVVCRGERITAFGEVRFWPRANGRVLVWGLGRGAWVGFLMPASLPPLHALTWGPS